MALFQMVERYYTAVRDLRFPFPSGELTYFDYQYEFDYEDEFLVQSRTHSQI